MEISVLKDLFFFGAADAIDSFIATLKPRCIKPSTENVTVDGSTMRTVYNSENDTYIAQNMQIFRKDPHLNNSLEPADSFRDVQILPRQQRFEMRNTRRHRVTTETVSERCIADGSFVVPYAKNTDLFLYRDNRDTRIVHGSDPKTAVTVDDSGYSCRVLAHPEELPDHDDNSNVPYSPEAYAEDALVKVYIRKYETTYGYFVSKEYYEAHPGLFEQCSQCHRIFLKRQNLLRNGRCEFCQDFRVFGYHNWNGRFVPKMASAETECNTYFGIELETEGNNADDRFLVAPYADLFHLERDGSLQESRAPFEMISQPLSYKAWMENSERLHALCQSLQDAGRHSHDTRTCGFHIHVSKTAFRDNEAIHRAVVIVNGLQTEMAKFGRRNGGTYCAFLRCVNKPNLADINRIVSECSGHYTCMNCSDLNDGRTNTLEFRFPRGTLNADTVLATIEFVNNIVAAANSTHTVVTFGDLCQTELVRKYIKNREESYGVIFDMTASVDFTIATIQSVAEQLGEGRLTNEEALARFMSILAPATAQPETNPAVLLGNAEGMAVAAA